MANPNVESHISGDAFLALNTRSKLLCSFDFCLFTLLTCSDNDNNAAKRKHERKYAEEYT